jgi:hypothetical protein
MRLHINIVTRPRQVGGIRTAESATILDHGASHQSSGESFGFMPARRSGRDRAGYWSRSRHDHPIAGMLALGNGLLPLRKAKKIRAAKEHRTR